MRFAWLALAAFMSMLAGAEGASMASEELESRSRPRSAVVSRAGFAVQGRSFYVWDEERHLAETWAAQLADSEASALAGRS
jgi:hypothetical protein